MDGYTVTVIGAESFKSNCNITSVIIPDTVTNIQLSAFQSCTELASVVIPDSVERIQSYAFSGSGLESLVIPDSVTNISADAFSRCISLASVTIGAGLTELSNQVFSGCTKLESIVIPKNITNISSNALVCKNLSEIIVDEDNEYYCSINGNLYSKDKTQLIIYAIGKKDTEFKIPDSVTSVSEYVISNARYLETLILSNSMTRIEDWTFAYASNLKTVIIPDSVTEIGASAFVDCENLTNVIIPDSVVSIGDGAFSYTNIAEIVIPGSVSFIDEFAFYDYGVLNKITILNPECELCDSRRTISPNAVIYGLNGSTAQTYAQKYDREFVTVCTDGKESHPFEVTTTASCTEDGVTTYTCPLCNYSYKENTLATGHNFVVQVIESTCTDKGYTKHSCTNCDYCFYDYIANEKGHIKKTTTQKATTSKNGSIVTKCIVCGDIESSTVIYYPKTITLSTTSYTYNGKVKKTGVTVKGSNGKTISSSNYTVTYSSGRKNVGTYKVTIKFKGNYSGTVNKTFTIVPKSTSISKITASKKRFTVKWNKQTTQTTGYQIQYSTDKNFKKNNKTVAVNKNSTTSKTISKLSSKKKYYVRIRTYKTVTVNGKSTKIYSAWSKSKTVTTKK